MSTDAFKDLRRSNPPDLAPEKHGIQGRTKRWSGAADPAGTKW
jgi:hypothetical protein